VEIPLGQKKFCLRFFYLFLLPSFCVWKCALSTCSLSSAAVPKIFISTCKLNFSVSVLSICSPIHVYCIHFHLFMSKPYIPYKIRSIWDHFHFFFSWHRYLIRVISVFSTMSALSFVVECDGFQVGNDNFSLKCLAVVWGRTRTTYYHIFDTNSLLSEGPDTLRTYWFQTLHHGLALALAGLVQAMAHPVLMHAVLGALYDLSEWGDVAPAQVIMWVKGTQKTSLVFSTMSALSFVVECDGFQVGNDNFW